MKESTFKIHYVLLQEDYYTSLKIRRIIDNFRPNYQFSGDSVFSFTGRNGIYISGVDLVIADIQLAEGVFFNLIPPSRCHTPVIIIADNNTFLKRMQGYNLVDYLLKPVSRQEMENSLNKFEEYYQLKS